MPDSALNYAQRSWEMRREKSYYFTEYLKSLYRLGEYELILSLVPFLRGNGYARYITARAEEETGSELHSIEIFSESLDSESNSIAADAALWLSILLDGTVSEDSIRTLAETAVLYDSSSSFYRCRLAGVYSEAGDFENAYIQLAVVRRMGKTDYYYWKSMTSLARDERDHERHVWAARRANECRRIPEAARNLGWALYMAGNNAMRSDDLVLAVSLLEEALRLEADEEITLRSDSLLGMIYEFMESSR